ncbi:MAG TPA: NADPH-dependent ferric siderophore reductase [Acidimicrobiaceae bacterium]|nr:NADPH-dependent ferric siderophore reductase [Acidimicrobiaceae bacterium]
MTAPTEPQAGPTTEDPPRMELVRHRLRLRMLEVREVQRPTPRVVRVALGGDELDGFSSDGPADHVKVFLPAPGERNPVVPTLGPDGIVPTDGPRPVGRDYTPRHHRLDEGLLELDFVLHDGGRASAWAAEAAVGDPLAVGGPRGSQVPAGRIEGLLLVADETGLPAVHNWLRWAPAGLPVTARIEVQDDADIQRLETAAALDVQWSTRGREAPGRSGVLVDALDALPRPAAGTLCWVAAETGVVGAVRSRLLRHHGVHPDRVHARGYWKLGDAGHEEPHSD